MTELDPLPYKSINVYIDRQTLEDILKQVLEGISSLPKPEQIAFVKDFRKYVKINGFRNPTMAPLALRVNAYANAFEEKDEVVPFSLSTWTKLSPEFAESVKNWLQEQDFENLALTREYKEEEGFMPTWPEDLSSDKLIKAFQKQHPDSSFDEDKLIVMALWIAGQLPRE
jgi:hypothetical protein